MTVFYATKDNNLQGSAAGTPPYSQRNNGTRTALITGYSSECGILQFDLSSIPAGATCTSSVLTLYQAGSGVAQAFTLTAYPIAVGNAGWVEGVHDNQLAGAGESCWDAKAADGAGGVTTAWAGSAGLATSGTDYEATALGTASGNRSDANGTGYALTLSATRVRGWFGAVNTNYGIKVVSNAQFGLIASRHHATAAYRPILAIIYTIPAAGAIFNPTFSAPLRGPFG